MKYRIKKLCFDSRLCCSPYEDNPTETFDTYEDAWNFIIKLAEEEVEDLNADCDEGISFGIPEDKAYTDKAMCRIEYYYNPDGDDTGNTEVVTQYWVTSKKEDKVMELTTVENLIEQLKLLNPQTPVYVGGTTGYMHITADDNGKPVVSFDDGEDIYY